MTTPTASNEIQITSAPCDCPDGQCAHFCEPVSACVNHLLGDVETLPCSRCEKRNGTSGPSASWHQNGICLNCLDRAARAQGRYADETLCFHLTQILAEYEQKVYAVAVAATPEGEGFHDAEMARRHCWSVIAKSIQRIRDRQEKKPPTSPGVTKPEADPKPAAPPGERPKKVLLSSIQEEVLVILYRAGCPNRVILRTRLGHTYFHPSIRTPFSPAKSTVRALENAGYLQVGPYDNLGVQRLSLSVEGDSHAEALSRGR